MLPNTFLIFEDLYNFDECWSNIVWTIPQFVLVSCSFLMDSLGMCLFGRITTVVKSRFDHLTSLYVLLRCLIDDDVCIGHLMEAVFSMFLHCKFTFPPFFHAISLVASY